MPDDIEEVKLDPSPEDLSKHRVKDVISPSEREVFVGRIKELEEEREQLKARIVELEKPKREPPKKSVLQRFSPL